MPRIGEHTAWLSLDPFLIMGCSGSSTTAKNRSCINGSGIAFSYVTVAK
jgi:hypothetical protein